METMEPIEEPLQRDEGRHFKNLAVSEIMNCNDENANVSSKITNNESETMKRSCDTNNSSLNPNALPFYPLQQLQNLNYNIANLVNEKGNQNFNGNMSPVYNMNAMNNMPMFHQVANQILVLRLPTGLPIHNQAGIQMPQMIIPLQIPVPALRDHDYHLPQVPIVFQEGSMATTPTTPMSVSPFEGIETTRHSSPIPFEPSLADMMETTQVCHMSTPEIACTSPIKKSQEELNLENIEPLKNNSVIMQQEAPESNPVDKPTPRYKISSPTKMMTRSRGSKPIESEKRPIEEPVLQSPETIPKMTQTKPSTKSIFRAKKSKASSIKVKSELDEIVLVKDIAITSNKETASVAEVENTVLSDAMEVAVEPQISAQNLIPLTGNKNTKTKGKAPKTNKAKATKNKKQSTMVEIHETVTVKQEVTDLSVKAKPGSVKAEPATVKTQQADIKEKMVVKKEEPVAIKSEPLSGNVTLLELPELDEDDEDLPEIISSINSTARKTTTATTQAEELEFQKEVEHYSKPEVQCQIFFPKLVVKRSQVRGDNCAVEYAVSGRSHCRICKTTIKKEELRFSIPVRERDFGYNTVIDTWHHARCFWGAYKVRSTYNMDGFQYLSQSDQNLIRECILQLK